MFTSKLVGYLLKEEEDKRITNVIQKEQIRSYVVNKTSRFRSPPTTPSATSFTPVAFYSSIGNGLHAPFPFPSTPLERHQRVCSDGTDWLDELESSGSGHIGLLEDTRMAELRHRESTSRLRARREDSKKGEIDMGAEAQDERPGLELGKRIGWNTMIPNVNVRLYPRVTRRASTIDVAGLPGHSLFSLARNTQVSLLPVFERPSLKGDREMDIGGRLCVYDRGDGSDSFDLEGGGKREEEW
ncbi:hypothetical protein EV361DRAFT_951533 [Lentinula raphanica]|nr:hypothetical protein EV361DRAFT_951533 [Lentinula raphanica]